MYYDYFRARYDHDDVPSRFHDSSLVSLRRLQSESANELTTCIMVHDVVTMILMLMMQSWQRRNGQKSDSSVRGISFALSSSADCAARGTWPRPSICTPQPVPPSHFTALECCGTASWFRLYMYTHSPLWCTQNGGHFPRSQSRLVRSISFLSRVKTNWLATFQYFVIQPPDLKTWSMRAGSEW